MEPSKTAIQEEMYGAEKIQALEGLEAVRKRPGMYIGSTGERGLHHLVYEVVDNSIDEALAGYCSSIRVIIYKNNSISVEDNGRGIPVENHSQFNMSALQVVMTKLHAGGKFDSKTYKVSGGLHGVGISVVNALSSELIVEVKRDGKLWRQTYSKGKPITELEIIGDSNNTGTKIRFSPDFEIMEQGEFSFEILSSKLRELAFLNGGIEITIEDERTEKKNEFKYDGGIISFVEYLNKSKEALHQVLRFNKKIEEVEVEAAIQYTTSYNESIFSFVNNINTTEGGTHLNGFKTALTRVFNKYSKDNKIGDGTLTGEDCREGITAIVSVKMQNPQFEGQTKTKLGNGIMKGIVDTITNEALSTYFEENPSIAKQIVQKCVQAAKVREAAKKARDLARRKGVLDSGSLPGKLWDCSSRKPEECEIYLVEGDSAAGTAKQARDRNYQAILPVFGKILNVEKARLSKVMNSEKLGIIISALGTGVGDEMNIDKIRYHKIILMSDSDVDGSHIKTLHLTLFYRYLRPVIDKGYLYIAQPPLFLIKKGKAKYYALDEKERDKILTEIGKEGVNIQRYKGLGEMNADQLWDTTMNPTSRKLLQINIQDAVEADTVFSMLMGENVEPRKEFIIENAKRVVNLDV